MRVFVWIAIFFYVIIISLVGFTSLLSLAHFIDLNTYVDFLTFVHKDPKANIISGFIVAATMVISWIFAQIIYGRQEKERTILIDNPLGRVSISVSAMEDLIRRMVVRTPQIKEIRPNIISKKKGLNIEIKLVLRSDSNIPALTAELQDMIKRKIQDLVGADERVNIRVHVVKISAESVEMKRGGRDDDDEGMGVGSQTVPFHGYRA
jgi:uncharacterized alkaline shock family protein YloU